MLVLSWLAASAATILLTSINALQLEKRDGAPAVMSADIQRRDLSTGQLVRRDLERRGLEKRQTSSTVNVGLDNEVSPVNQIQVLLALLTYSVRNCCIS